MMAQRDAVCVRDGDFPDGIDVPKMDIVTFDSIRQALSGLSAFSYFAYVANALFPVALVEKASNAICGRTPSFHPQMARMMAQRSFYQVAVRVNPILHIDHVHSIHPNGISTLWYCVQLDSFVPIVRLPPEQIIRVQSEATAHGGDVSQELLSAAMPDWRERIASHAPESHEPTIEILAQFCRMMAVREPVAGAWLNALLGSDV